MTKRTLSEKGFEIDGSHKDYKNVYYEEDVKEFIKEILDEIEREAKEKEKHIGYIEGGIWNEGAYSAFIKSMKIIKQKAGEDLI